MAEGDQFLVRDTRMPGHFWADNEVLDLYGSHLGAHAFAVYMAMCRSAINGTGECKISTRKLAQQLGMSAGGAYNALVHIVRLGLVRQIHPGDRSGPGIYILADVKALVNPEIAQLKLAGRGAHQVNTPPLRAHTVSTPVHPVNAGAHQVNDVLTGCTRNKEVKTYKTSNTVNTKGKDNTPDGALKSWLAIKSELEGILPAEQFKLWLRPMYLLKEMADGQLLLSLPPSGKIVEAARANRELLLTHVQAHGFKGICFTKYPDDYQRDRIRNEYPEFYEQMLGNKASA